MSGKLLITKENFRSESLSMWGFIIFLGIIFSFGMWTLNDFAFPPADTKMFLLTMAGCIGTLFVVGGYVQWVLYDSLKTNDRQNR